MWERSVHIPLGGKNVVIYQLSSCFFKKKYIQSYIVYSMCMKFAFTIRNRGKAKLMLLFSVRNTLWLQRPWEMLRCFFWLWRSWEALCCLIWF